MTEQILLKCMQRALWVNEIEKILLKYDTDARTIFRRILDKKHVP